MLKQGTKANRTGSQVKHIKKISAQPAKNTGTKSATMEAEGPRTGGGCIPVGN